MAFLVSCSSLGYKYEGYYSDGIAQFEQGQYVQALTYFDKALAVYQHHRDYENAIYTLVYIVKCYEALQEFQLARDADQKTIQLERDITNQDYHSSQIASVFEKLGLFHLKFQNYDRAKPLLERSLTIRENVLGLEHEHVAISLHNLAILYSKVGDYARAEELYNRSLTISKSLSSIAERCFAYEREVMPASLSNLAQLQAYYGNYGEAKKSLEQSLIIHKRIFGPKHTRTAANHISMAGIYRILGDNEKAKVLSEHALKILQKHLNSEYEVMYSALNQLAWVYIALGEDYYDQVEPVLKRSLEICKKYYGLVSKCESGNLSALAKFHNKLGNHTKAKQLFERSLAINEEIVGPEHQEIGIGLLNLAISHRELGEYARAKSLLERALHIAETLQIPRLHWAIEGGYSRLLVKLKQNDAAILFGKRAVNRLQEQRARLKTLDEELQKSHLSTIEDFYYDLADLLVEQGRLLESQQVLNMLKEVAFHDSIPRDSEDDALSTQANFTQVETDWQKEYQGIADQLVVLSDEMRMLKEKKSAHTEKDDARMKELNKNMEIASHVFRHMLGELTTVFKQGDTGRNFVQ